MADKDQYCDTCGYWIKGDKEPRDGWIPEAIMTVVNRCITEISRETAAEMNPYKRFPHLLRFHYNRSALSPGGLRERR